MLIPRTSQLEWVRRNRQPKASSQAVGALVKGLLNEDFADDVRHRARVQRAVAEIADEAFREACTLGPTDRNSVTILVEHPAFLYALRLAWCFPLVEHLDRRCRFGVTPKVRFRLGKSSDRFIADEPIAD